MSDREKTAIPRLGTIRAQLLISFVAIVLLPATLIGLVLTVSGAQGEKSQAFKHLDSALSYKEAAIQDWTNMLKVELGNTLIGENTMKNVQFLVSAQGQQSVRSSQYYQVQVQMHQLKAQTQQFDEISLMNPAGEVLVSTNGENEGKKIGEELYFTRALIGPYVNPPYYSTEKDQTILLILRPVLDESRKVVAVLSGQARLGGLQAILAGKAGMGETGQSYLVGSSSLLLAGLDPNQMGAKLHSAGINAVLSERVRDSSSYLNYKGTPVLGAYHWIPELEAALIGEEEAAESGRANTAVMAVNASVGLTSLLIAILAALSVTQRIANPVSEMAEAATHASTGNLHVSIDVDREDELGALAKAFNSMVLQLSSFIGGLEQKVADRTLELEQRSRYLEASTLVSHATGSIIEADALIGEAVRLIRERFDLYYVGLFLLDENKEWAVLRAGTGEAGQAMLARGHRLRAGGVSMIGWAVANGEARIALKAGEDPVRLATAELPDTRSEASIPLRSRGQVTGALTVQSDRVNAFDSAAISVLQVMADQIAVAIENARLYSESQQALEAMRRMYNQTGRAAWQETLASRPDYAYLSSAAGEYDASHIWRPEMEQALEGGKIVVGRPGEEGGRQPLAVPIKVRGAVVGVLDTYKPGAASPWTAEEIGLIEAITEQVGIALDTARLYLETQQQADRERLVGEISTHFHQTLDVDVILQTAVREMYQALGLQDVTIRLEGASSQSPNGNGSHGPNGRARRDESAVE